MSLDVYLTMEEAIPVERGSGIFVRENGTTKEITREEWDSLHPGQEPVTFQSTQETTNRVYSANITHNLNKMAMAVGMYNHLWRPEEIGITKAKELVIPLWEGLLRLKSDPAHFKMFDSPNGWGLYIHFVPFVENYLKACISYPEAKVEANR